MEREITPYIHNNRLLVTIKPNAKSNHVLGWDDERKSLRIAIAAPARDNKANRTLTKFLTAQTGRACTITSGQTSRTKLITFS